MYFKLKYLLRDWSFRQNGHIVTSYQPCIQAVTGTCNGAAVLQINKGETPVTSIATVCQHYQHHTNIFLKI